MGDLSLSSFDMQSAWQSKIHSGDIPPPFSVSSFVPDLSPESPQWMYYLTWLFIYVLKYMLSSLLTCWQIGFSVFLHVSVLEHKKASVLVRNGFGLLLCTYFIGFVFLIYVFCLTHCFFLCFRLCISSSYFVFSLLCLLFSEQNDCVASAMWCLLAILWSRAEVPNPWGADRYRSVGNLV